MRKVGEDKLSNLTQCLSQKSNSGSLILNFLLLALYYITFLLNLPKDISSLIGQLMSEIMAMFYYWTVFLLTVWASPFFSTGLLICDKPTQQGPPLWASFLCPSSSTQLIWWVFSGLFNRAVILLHEKQENPYLASGPKTPLRWCILGEFGSMYMHPLCIMLVLCSIYSLFCVYIALQQQPQRKRGVNRRISHKTHFRPQAPMISS